jgi:ribosomal 50S subunit-recycling heat shock protein
MRIDKFLKVSRVVKKRSIAKMLADNEKIKVNDKIAKPSTVVEIDDEIDLTFGEKHLKIRVVTLLNNPKKEDAATMIEILEQ